MTCLPIQVRAGPLMDDAELQAFEALPDEVQLLRGCYALNKWGLSWTLDRATACRFPFLNRYWQEGQALLVTARAKKSDLIALKQDRDELEIIAWRPKHIKTIHLHRDLVEQVYGFPNHAAEWLRRQGLDQG